LTDILEVVKGRCSAHNTEYDRLDIYAGTASIQIDITSIFFCDDKELPAKFKEFFDFLKTDSDIDIINWGIFIKILL